jgi:hypothetical protein
MKRYSTELIVDVPYRMEVAFKGINPVAHGTIPVVDNPGSIGKGSETKLLNLPASNAFTDALLVVGAVV